MTRLLSASALMTAARGAGAAAGFVSQILLARLLSPSDLGLYVSVTGIAMVVGLISSQGYSGIISRHMTRYRERGQHDHEFAFIAHIERELRFACAAIAAGAALSFVLVPADHRILVMAGALCAIATASMYTYPSLAYVDRRIALGQLPETLIRPLAFLAVLATITLLALKVPMPAVLFCYAGISAALALFQMLKVRRKSPQKPVVINPRMRKRWRNEARPLIFLVLFTMLFADLAVVLSWPFLASANLAAFAIGLKISLLCAFTIQISHQVTTQDLAEALHHQRRAQLDQALITATCFPTAVLLFCMMGWTVAGEPLLRLFGPSFVSAKWPVAILIAAQIVRAAFGPTAVMLNLRGSSRVNAAIAVFCCVTLLALNALLIPALNVTGACLSVFLTIIVWCGASAVMLYRLHGDRTDIVFALAKWIGPGTPRIIQAGAPKL